MDRILNVVPTGREGDEATATDFDFLLDSLRPVPSSVSLSHQTTNSPPTPSIPSTSRRLIRMISTQVLYLDSNPLP